MKKKQEAIYYKGFAIAKCVDGFAIWSNGEVLRVCETMGECKRRIREQTI
jgi:hypothetical protein